MQYNVLEYLEDTVNRVPGKMAFSDGNFSVTFAEVYRQSRAVGTWLSVRQYYNEPVVVFMNKHPKTITAFLGVIYSGNHYVPLDEEMPLFRVGLILETLKPRIVICDSVGANKLAGFGYTGMIVEYDDIADSKSDDEVLRLIRDRQIDTDAIYVVFTSGSTGVPKGIVACHRSVIDYMEAFTAALELNETAIFGMQVPLYFDACLKEVFSTLKFGASTYLIPRSLFMFPVKLVEFMNENKINTVCWVVSALTMISAFGALEKSVPVHLKTIAFGSEVMPVKQLDLWRKALPGAHFYNLYGPTEATGMSCFYKVSREFSEGEVIPIGKPFRNTSVFLLKENNEVAGFNETGEICIRGTALTMGYYRSFDKTAEVFVQNPLNKVYPELIYRTGDLARMTEDGDLIFVSRKDDQIKHMGHRIELGEIESQVSLIEGIGHSCCLYDKSTDRIVLFYSGDTDEGVLIKQLRGKLPRYMLPNTVERMDKIPLMANSKIDRSELKRRLNSNIK
ncbi:MAG: amino acid adenylation domain-containing protein [Eubacteriales bacterium]|nr:amino acid adenylation domain-containing protein [Eubacteriales bacterium]